MINIDGSGDLVTFPADIAAGLQRHLASVVDETIATIAREVPAYTRPLEGAFGVGLRRGVEVALGRFLSALPEGAPPALSASDREVYLRLGRGEMRAGRPLESLLRAYRIGAQVAFRRFAVHARDDGLDADAIVPLAEAVFAYIDELSAASVEGYAREQSMRADEQARRRRDLLELLLTSKVDTTAVAEAAAELGWPVPGRAMAAIVPVDRADTLRGRVGAETLVAEHGDAVVAIMPVPRSADGRERLHSRLRQCAAVVGPGRPLAEVATSLRLAGAAARLRAAGVIDADPLFADEHLATLVVHADPELLAEIATKRLSPLGSVRASSRERLMETLLAWLERQGQRQDVAEALHVHPQTVSYRLAQLRDLFGEQLDDPSARLELQIALRARVRAERA